MILCICLLIYGQNDGKRSYYSSVFFHSKDLLKKKNLVMSVLGVTPYSGGFDASMGGA